MEPNLKSDEDTTNIILKDTKWLMTNFNPFKYKWNSL